MTPDATGRRAVLAAAGALAAPWPLRAQEAWPARPVRYINPYTAGGPTDTLSRQLCQKMAELSGQQFVVENRTGSGGIVGNLAIAPSPPDGYTLGLGGIATHAIAPTLYARLPFDPQRDFTFTSGMWQLPNLLVVNNDIPARWRRRGRGGCARSASPRWRAARWCRTRPPSPRRCRASTCPPGPACAGRPASRARWWGASRRWPAARSRPRS